MADVPDPFKPSPDATILRPRPGAGRRSEPAPRPAAPAEPIAEPLPAARAVESPGLSPLVQAASPLLLLAGQLRGVLSAPDVGGLRRHALDEIRRFEDRARSAGISNEVIVAARYVLCAGLDEAVLSTPWGSQSEWAQQTLLITLHREAWGGEKFFEMLSRIGQEPARHIDLMELQYLCLSFGFSGKFQALPRGQAQLAEVQQELYRQIRTERGVPQPDLSLRWRGLEDRRNPLIRYVPWWVVGAAALAVLSITFVFFYVRLGSAAAPVEAALGSFGRVAPPSRPAPVGEPSLKQLLSNEEQRNLLSVQESGGQTVITLNAPAMFASGSADVSRDYVTTLQRVADALNQVSGRVMVVGHTDDQPLRSLQYRNNVELSRARAAKVVEILGQTVRIPARLDSTGVGESQPLSGRPPSDAANRRVEIIHYSGS